jgi:hypothetical protein
MAERTLRDLIAPGVPQSQGLDLGRIKRNVGKMVEQGAPEDEIDAYISAEGTNVDAIKAFKPQQPDVAVDMAKGAGYGFNEGLDATLNMIGAPVRAPVNYIADKLGYGEVIPELNAARRFNVAGPAETTAGRVTQAIGEVAGGSAIPTAGLLTAGRMAGTAAPGIVSQYASAPGVAAALDATSSAGAGLGVAAARENNLGPVGEIAAGLAGGVIVPNAVNIASRTYGGAKAGLGYANRMVDRARNPEAAAYKDIADVSVKAGLDFDKAMNAVAPPTSSNLARRGFTQDDMAEIISRQLGGENADDVAQDYRHLVDAKGRPVTGDTARKYLQRYQEDNPTPMNVVDLAKEQLGTGGAIPLANQLRADMAIADDPVAGQRLIQRQREQPGRTADVIIEQTNLNGRNYEDEVERLKGVGKVEEDQAYGLAKQNANPVKINNVLQKWRRLRPAEGGSVDNTINKAIDLFYRSGYDESGGKVRHTKFLEVVDDVPTFLERRYELDQLIAESYKDMKPTPLTAKLTQFRTEVNNAARANNKALEAADARFSGNRTTERLLQAGMEMGKKLTPKSRQALREFNSLTENQKEVVRLSFERSMADQALGTRRGLAAADQFNSEAFERIIAALYPKSSGKDVAARGAKLLRNLKREAISTETNRDGLSGSRTAALQDDMAEMMEGPRAAADLATGRWGRLLENISNRLTRQIGQKAAAERVRILTDTDPANRLTILRRLRDEAKTSAERQTLDLAIKNFARVGRRPAVDIGTIVSEKD